MSKKISKLVTFIIFLGIMWILPTKVKANTLTISAANTTLTPGQTTTITVSSDSIGRVNLSVSGNATITGDRVWVEGNSQSFTLTATGTGTVTITATPENPMSLNGSTVDLSATSCTINVKEASTGGSTDNGSSNNANSSSEQTPAPTKSSVATLSDFGIIPNDFKGFTPNQMSYSVTVPNSVSSIEIYAKQGQSGQTISGAGKKTLQEGTNTFNVVVTAEDGKTTKTYTLEVVREATEEGKTEENTTEDNTATEETPEEEPTEETEEIEVGLSTLKIEGITLSPTFSKGVYEYTAKLIGETTTLNISTTALDESQKIEIVGNEDLKEGENVITILISDEAGENTVTYQITVNKSLVDEEAIAKEKQEQEKQKRLIIIGTTVAAIVIIAIILIIKHRKNAQYDMEYTEPYFEDDWGIEDNNQIENDFENNNFENNNFKDNIEQQEQEDFNPINQFGESDNKPKKRKPSKGKRFK